jgi:DNA-binding NarL/FixJ family response regulator
VRIMIADSEANVRFALRALLEHQAGLQVVGEAATWEGLLGQIKSARPDVLLLAWDLKGLPGSGPMPALHRRWPHLAVIALSSRPEIRSRVLASGVRAFVGKVDPPKDLMATLTDMGRQTDRACNHNTGEKGATTCGRTSI